MTGGPCHAPIAPVTIIVLPGGRMPQLTYTAPATVEDAVRALAAATGVAKPLSGGTDLLVQLRTGRAKPDLIVDTKRIPGMIGMREESGGFVIGAATPGAELGEHPGLEEGVAGRGRGGEAHRLDPDPGPRHAGGQSLQRLAGRRQRAGDDRRRASPASSPDRTGGARCRSRRSAPAPGKTSLAQAARSIVAFKLPPRPPRSATPICASFRAPRWTSPWSAAAST